MHARSGSDMQIDMILNERHGSQQPASTTGFKIRNTLSRITVICIALVKPEVQSGISNVVGTDAKV